MKQKGEVAKVAERVLNRLEVQSGRKLKTVRTGSGRDRGKEYVNKAPKEVFRGKGTVHEKTVLYTAEQNGSAERLNRVLEEKIRAMLVDSKLLKEMWAKAVVTANCTRNRTPVSAHGKTPWEAFFGKTPSVGHIRVFGARAFTHVPKQRRRKLEPMCKRRVFVGYEPESKAYRVLGERDGSIIISRDVIFDEGAKGEGIVKVTSDPTEDLPTSDKVGAQVPKTVGNGLLSHPCRRGPTQGPPKRTGAQDPLGTHSGQISEPRGQESAQPEEVGDDLQTQPVAAQRYLARTRRAPGKWYRADMAAELAAGEEHPKGSGEHPEPQSY